MRPRRLSPKRVARTILAIVLSLGAVRAASAEPYGYVSNTNTDTVSVLDTATDTIVATIPIVSSPFGVAFPIGEPKAYLLAACGGVVGCPSGGIHVLDTATNIVTNVIATGGGPSVSLAVNPAMPRIYVANNTGSLSIIDRDAETLITTIPVWPFTTSVGVHPSGDRAYVVSQGGTTGIVQVLDTTTNAIARTIDIGGPAFGVAFNPGGDRAYFTHDCASDCGFAVGAVDVLDTATESVLARIPVGEFPRGIVVNTAGTRVYVANAGEQNGGTISVISTAANAVIDTIAVGPRPWSLALHPDGSKLYAVNNGDATVSVVELGARDGGTTIPIGSATQARGTFMTAAVVPADCGDGGLDAGEACDDGNFIDGDGCDHDCSITACGNGIVSVGEQCDDGNTADGDDCSAACGRTGCGDGVITAGEQCDDGNVTGGDGCDPTCRLELIPGGGKVSTDCAVEWAVANGTTPPRYDHKGRPSAKQTCRDGDAPAW